MQNLVSPPITFRKSILGSERWETTKSGAKIKSRPMDISFRQQWSRKEMARINQSSRENRPPGEQLISLFIFFIALGVSNLRRETSVCILSKTVCLSHSFDSSLEEKREDAFLSV
ncbi:hypothetical protein CEXT_630951 [Caerostris extrusa]|uniref:Ycf15 n=1 Tax=Caerostris extrusa TaxID=172846 RepID=A0AAV4S0D2_CAEEX|nr:hypothetical protein CEXT_630951 [Caerostris extrusa]